MRDFTRQSLAICLSWTFPLLPAGAVAAPALPAKAPAADAASDKLRTETHLAREAYVAHNYDVAIQHYEQAVKLGATLPVRLRIKLITNLGAAYREAKKFTEAKESFKQAISLAEQNHIETDASTQMAMRQYAVLLRKMGQPVDADLMEARASGTRAGGALATGDAVSITIKGPATSAPTLNTSGGPKTAADFTSDQIKEMLDKHPTEPVLYKALAYKYASEKKWQESLNTLAEMKSKLPTEFADCRADYIESLAKCDRIEDAMEQCRVGIEEQPTKSAFYLMLSNYQIATGDMKGTLDTYEKFLEKFPDDANYSVISSRVNSMRKDAETKQTQSAKEPTMQERMYNWPNSYFPLKVFVASEDVQLSPGSGGEAPATGNECVEATCSAWSQATHGKVSFVIVHRAEEANIEVAFSPDRNMMENPSAAGIAQWSGRGEAPKVRITLLTTEDDKPIAGDRLLEACLHEFGHALGLSHSKSVDDVMYFSERTKPMTQLSGNDAQRVIVLYTR
jgi:tetratricopeptide (TPR) repeat protein